MPCLQLWPHWEWLLSFAQLHNTHLHKIQHICHTYYSTLTAAQTSIDLVRHWAWFVSLLSVATFKKLLCIGSSLITKSLDRSLTSWPRFFTTGTTAWRAGFLTAWVGVRTATHRFGHTKIDLRHWGWEHSTSADSPESLSQRQQFSHEEVASQALNVLRRSRFVLCSKWVKGTLERTVWFSFAEKHHWTEREDSQVIFTSTQLLVIPQG